jgi:hypothetical protein
MQTTANESSDEQQAPKAINAHKAATVAQPLISDQVATTKKVALKATNNQSGRSFLKRSGWCD